ncbi:phage scaffolding protein [Clostridium beijerinckii]|uniref:phage scaffolding protein n=1 Tax=Clostridium beijerinckii TaxID=1520 RepID=UPI001F1B363D|nr:phage scaffolding protein [Clostridium beijerinckii]
MKREFLKSIEGLTDEAIDKIMAEVGKDIAKEQAKAEQVAEKSKTQIETLQSELNSKDEMLDNVNSEIEKYKGMDIESIKKSADEWKNKYTEFENQTKAEKEAYEKKLKDQQYDFKLNEIAGQHKFVDDIAKEAFINNLKKQEFKFGEDGTLQGANDYINKFKEEHKGIFVTETPSEPAEPQLPTFSLPTTGQTKTENTNPFGFNFNYLRKPKE